jgi:hypothetical protein
MSIPMPWETHGLLAALAHRRGVGLQTLALEFVTAGVAASRIMISQRPGPPPTAEEQETARTAEDKGPSIAEEKAT